MMLNPASWHLREGNHPMKSILPLLCWTLFAVGGQPAATTSAQSGIVLKTFPVRAGKLLLDPTRSRLYATLPQDNGLAVIDTDTNSLLTTLTVGASPVDLAISPDGTRLYVAKGSSSFGGNTAAAAGISTVDLDSLTVLNNLPAPFLPSAIASGLGGRIYLLAAMSDTFEIAQIDASTGTVQSTYNGDVRNDYGGFLQISPDRTTLFYANAQDFPAALARFDVSTATFALLQEDDSYDLGENGEGLTISHSGQFLVYPNGSGNTNGQGTPYYTTLIPTSDVTGILGTFQTGTYPNIAAFSGDDTRLYQLRTGSPLTLEVFSTQTFTQLDSFTIPNLDNSGGTLFPTSLAVTSPNGYLYVAAIYDVTSLTTGQLMNLGNLRLFSTQRAPFFAGSVALSDGFYYLKFADGVPFGYYNFNYSPYLYHSDLGFEYPFDAADGSNGVYLYDFTSKTFFYTSSSLFPYLYDFTLNTFLYYYPDPADPDHYNTDGTRYFYDFATGQVISK